MNNPTEQQFSSAVEAAAAWQVFLDESFPQGATFSQVMADGRLDPDGRFNFPVLVVMQMRGEWPVLMSFDGDQDVLMYINSWEEIDRDGHYVVRTQLLPLDSARSGLWELNSWFSEGLAEFLAPHREKLRRVLMDQAQFAGPAGELVVQSSSDIDTESMELAYVNPHVGGVALSAPSGTVPEVVSLTRSS
ncbi:MAG: hypothetical protein WC054_01020 [Candidatus Nanopelagicales bacterium]